MKRTILFTLAISLLPVAAQSQAADVEAIKTNIEQMWKDMAQGKADPNKFDQNHNLTAYSSGGLWEDQTANELATTLVGGGVTLSVKPHHVKVTLLGEKKDVAHATYYLSGKILKGSTVAVRWSPSFGQRDSGVKVDTMRFDRLLFLCSLRGWFPLSRPLNMSGVPGSAVDTMVRCALAKLSTLMLLRRCIVMLPFAECIPPSASGHRHGSSTVVPRCSSAATYRWSGELAIRLGSRAGRHTRT